MVFTRASVGEIIMVVLVLIMRSFNGDVLTSHWCKVLFSRRRQMMAPGVTVVPLGSGVDHSFAIARTGSAQILDGQSP